MASAFAAARFGNFTFWYCHVQVTSFRTLCQQHRRPWRPRFGNRPPSPDDYSWL